ncbi:MAG: restriction endonuclease subunit S [Candidatus Velthaea sp.]
MNKQGTSNATHGRLKWIARFAYGSSLAAELRREGPWPVYGSGGQSGWHDEYNTASPALIVGRKGSFGSVFFVPTRAFCIDTAYYIDKRHSKANLRWLYYALQTLGLGTISQDTGVPGLSRDTAYNSILRCPALAEQTAIVAFLDRETSRADALVAKYEWLIELLEEKRVALITQAVTKGLDPAVPMKDSGVEWIGEIPAHWFLLPLFALAEERGETNELYVTNNVLSLLKDIGVINYEDKGAIGNKKSEDVGRYKIVNPGDLVINSMNVIIGSVGISSEFGCLSPVYIVLKSRKDFSTDMPFIELLFQTRTFQRWLTRIGYGILAHRMRIPMSNLKREVLPVPPENEREGIISFVSSETAKIVALVKRARTAIDLIKERRSALITAAVTGQIDVSKYDNDLAEATI